MKNKGWKSYCLIILALLCCVYFVFALFTQNQSSLGIRVNSTHDYQQGSWVAFGEMRSHIEPCGCNPETDLGGVIRVYEAIQEFRKTNSSHVFVLGNMYDEQTSSQKVDLTQSLLTKLSVDAFLVNHQELDYLLNSSNATKLPYVLSNVKASSTKKLASVAQTISFGKAVVYGFLSASHNPSVLESVDVYIKSLKKQNSSENILLFSGNESELEKLHESQYFSTIISANNRILGEEPDQLEVERLGLLHWFGDIYKVPVFSQGLLLGEKFRKSKEQPSLLFEKHSKNTPTPTNMSSIKSLSQSLEFVLWLDKSYQRTGDMDDAYNIYQAAQGGAFNAWAVKRSQHIEGSPFVGADACKTCHVEAYDVWENSAHHHALATLQSKNKDRDLDCISCHVLGFEEKGGYSGEDSSPHLANVQCENCHGPAKEHIKNPSSKPAQNPKGACVSCHHTPHTTDFDFNEYWQRIKHK